MNYYIAGTGSSLPEKVVTNTDLSKILDTNDEWISSRTGIRERRVLSHETLLDIAAEAGRRAIEDAKISANDIDMIICTTLSGDYITPSMSCLLKQRLGCSAKHLLDVNMACSGFIYALDIAAAYFESGRVSSVLIVSAEAMSRLLDWSDRSTAVLFGDGAGAVVLKKGNALIDIHTDSQPDENILNIGGVVNECPFSDNYAREVKRFNMDGQEVFMFAVSTITKSLRAMLERNSLTPDEISMFVLHQANIRIMNTARKKFGQPEEKFPHNIEHLGNTSSASIPILLDELNKTGKLVRGGKLILCAFGAGLTTGTCLIEWQK